MKMFSFLFFFMINVTFAQTMTHPELQKLNTKYEAKLNHTLNSFFQDTSTYDFSLKIDAAIEKAKSQHVDFGYAPTPLVETTEPAFIKIQSSSVKVVSYKKLKPQEAANLKQLVRLSLAEINPRVEVQTIARPEIEKVEKPVSTPIPEKTLLQKLKEDTDFWKNLIFIVAIGVFSFFAFRFFTQNLLKIVREFGGVFAKRNSNERNEFSSKEKIQQSQEEELPPPIPLAAILKLQPEDALKLFHTHIFQASDKLKRILTTDPKNLIGFRKVATLVNDDARSKLNFCISEEFKKALVREERTEVPGYNFDEWLIDTVEKVSMAIINEEEGAVDRLGVELVTELKKVEFEKMLNAVRTHNMPAGWVVLDLVFESSLFGSGAALLTPHDLDHITQLSDLDDVELKKNAEELLNISKSTNRKTEKANDKIAAIYVSVLRDRDFPADEEFINETTKRKPEIGKLIASQYWSQRIIPAIPEEILKAKLMSFSMEDKYLLLVGVAEEFRETVFKVVPEGKTKLILADKLKKSSLTKEEIKAGSKIVKKMLEDLRVDAEAGKFTILEKESSESEQVADFKDAKPNLSVVAA